MNWLFGGSQAKANDGADPHVGELKKKVWEPCQAIGFASVVQHDASLLPGWIVCWTPAD